MSTKGFGLFEGQDSGFLRKRGMRFGVVILTRTQDLVILQGSNWEMSLQIKKEIGNSETKMPLQVTLEIAERYNDVLFIMVSKLNHNYSKGNRLK